MTGSCLCGSVKYTINDEIMSVVNCHCKTCKKITGGAFETIVVMAENALEITSGQEILKTYRINGHADKNFCGACGTPIYNQLDKYTGVSLVHVGSLDDPSVAVPEKNIFCESMLPWVNTISELVNFDREPKV